MITYSFWQVYLFCLQRRHFSLKRGQIMATAKRWLREAQQFRATHGSLGLQTDFTRRLEKVCSPFIEALNLGMCVLESDLVQNPLWFSHRLFCSNSRKIVIYFVPRNHKNASASTVLSNLQSNTICMQVIKDLNKELSKLDEFQYQPTTTEESRDGNFSQSSQSLCLYQSPWPNSTLSNSYSNPVFVPVE